MVGFCEDYWTIGLLDYWTIGLLDYWTIGLLDYWKEIKKGSFSTTLFLFIIILRDYLTMNFIVLVL